MSSRRISLWRALAAIALAAALPTSADANGRYPQTTSITFQPGNQQRIFVGATFGLLISEDDGASWRWTCEQNIGYGGVFDPVYAVSAPGTIYATTFDGLSISRDSGCHWSYAGGGLAGHWASDVQVTADGAIWVTTSSGGMPNDVFVSQNDGVGFTSVGLLHDRAWWKSVRVAPTDPTRVYVTGYQLADESVDGGDGMPTPLLYRGELVAGVWAWTELPFAYEDESQFFLLAVSPIDPDVVFARVNGALRDTLLRSDNGGLSWAPVLSFDGDGADLVSFVVRQDGLHLIAGTIGYGVRVSDDGGNTWSEPTQQPKMACVGERSGATPRDQAALFTCGANWNPDRLAIGRSTDGGQTWQKTMRFIDLDNELACPAGDGHNDKCAGLWTGIACQFGIGKPDAGVGPDASIEPDAGAPPSPGPDCGCSMGLAAVLLVVPWPRRRRPPEA